MEDGRRDNEWLAAWLDGVDERSMSQRQHAAIERNGGIDAARREATRRGIHLLELTDDKGVRLVAASRHPFHVLC